MKRVRPSLTAINNYTTPQSKRIKLDIKAPVLLSSLVGIRLDVRLPKELVSELKGIRDLTRERFIEFGGTIPFERVNNTIFFEPPKRITNKNRGGINMSGAVKSYMSYHSHPSVSNYFTLPSDADIGVYIRNYDKMQVNIVIDNNGYYIVDYIETTKSAVVRDRALIMKTYKELVEEFNKYIKIISGYVYYTPPSAATWKAMVKRVFSALPSGLSVTYYTFGEQAIVTLKPPKTTPPRVLTAANRQYIKSLATRIVTRSIKKPRTVKTSPRKSIVTKSMARNGKSGAAKSTTKTQRNRRNETIRYRRSVI